MQTVPTTFEDAIASLNAAACGAMGVVVSHLCVGCWIDEWRHQPVRQHIASVSEDQPGGDVGDSLEVRKHRTFSQDARIMNAA